MATLTGSTIASTYTGLLSVSGAVGADTVEAVTDGAGTSTSLSLSQQRATIALGSGAADDFIVDTTTLVVEGDNNRVGIGTAAPSTQLHITNAASDKPIILLETTEAGTSSSQFNFYKNSASPIDNDVLGMIKFQGNTDNGSGGKTSDRVTFADIYVQSTDTTDNSKDSNIVFRTHSADTETTTMVLNSGKVGIGIASPDNPLEISHTDQSNVTGGNIADNSAVGLHIDKTGDHDGAGSVIKLSSNSDGCQSAIGHIQVDDNDADLAFYTDNGGTLTEAMRIDNSQKVGIGTASPVNSKLCVADTFTGTQSSSEGIRFIKAGDTPHYNWIENNISSAASLMALFVDSGTDNTSTRMLTARRSFDSDGSTVNTGIGIGVEAATAKLHVLDWGFTDTDGQVGFKVEQKKTGGNSDTSDHYSSIYCNLEFDDGDQGFGDLRGINNTVYNNSSVSSSEQIGIFTRSLMDGSSNLDNIYGSYTWTDIDGGTVDNTVYGTLTDIDIDGGTLSNDVMGVKVNMNSTVNPSGSITTFYVNMGGIGVSETADNFLLFYDTSNSDVVARITALAGVATFDSGNFSGASDYAEYFESKDGKAIAVGTTVKLDGDKVVACSEGDTPIGVVRPDGVGTSAYKAGAQNLRWHGKYLSDEYNELQHEDYTVKEWTEEITFDEYIAVDKDETGGVLGGHVKDKKIEGKDAIPAKDAVMEQKTVDEEVEEEVTTTEVVLEDGKYVQKTTTETVTKTVKVPQYNDVDLYDKDGEVIGKHKVPIMETVEEAVAAVDAVPETYTRKHNYHSDRIPEGLTVPNDAVTLTPNHQRKKLNPDYDASKHDSYKPRPDRDEWNLIGLLGQIPITKGQPLSDNWIKMKDVSDTVEMYFVK